MKYYVLTFHLLKQDAGFMDRMIKEPMVFDSREGAVDYGSQHVDYVRTDCMVHECVLFSQPVENNG